jgi:uroporphyrinogen-III synthase
VDSAVRRVLVTRPQLQSPKLETLLRDRGVEPVALPLFAIEAQGDAAGHRATLAQARDWSGWLFTSANAARAVAALDAGRWPALYAIGAATAATLAGHPGARHASTGSTSEDLLEHPDLRDIAGQHFLICTGAGGRDTLERGLQARGALATRLELYRRVAVDYAPAHVTRCVDTTDAAICTSGESVERLLALVPEDRRALLFSRRLVVPSARVLELARRLGWSSVRAPATTSDEALVDCLLADR